MANSFDPNRFTPFAGPPPSLQDVIPADGFLPAGSPPDSDALFGALLPLEWNAIGIPYARLDTEVRQDLVIHKFADRNGAHIEGTGRHPLQFTAHVPFLNGIAAGPNESWQRPLYPFTRDNLLRAALIPGSGPLQHPELGIITCKLETMRWSLDANVRSGVWCDLVWIESDDTGLELDQNLSEPSPLAGMQAAAADLDGLLPSFSPVITPSLPTFNQSFEDLVFQARGIVDQFTIMSPQPLEVLEFQCNELETSLDLARNATCLNWPAIQACERMRASVLDQKRTQLTKGRPIGFYTVAKDSTLAQVCSTVGSNITDMMMLNPGYVGQPVLEKDTVVRYYRQAA